MGIVRIARHEDMNSLMALFAAAEVSATVSCPERAEQIWRETIASQHIAVFVVDDLKDIMATCTLITAPNLLRGGRRHGFLENVVTHPDHRGRGYGKAAVTAALEHAWSIDCHHVLMQSGRAGPQVHRFYEGIGFKPGIRTGYVAMRPQDSIASGL